MLAVFVLLRYKYIRKAPNYPQNRDFPGKKCKKIKDASASPQTEENRGWFSGIPRFFLLWLFNFNGPVNRALDDRQVFFGTEFQLVADPLALLTFRT